MSDEIKKKMSYDEFAFRYDFAVRKAVDELFSSVDQHGWTEEEFSKIYYEEALKNAVEANERVLH